MYPMTASLVTADGAKTENRGGEAERSSPLTLYGRAFSRLFFPETCPLCNKDLRSWEKKICGACETLLCEVRAPLCPLCARELPPFSGFSVCGECRHSPHSVDRTWSLFSYNEPLKKMLHFIKFCGRPALLHAFETSLKTFVETADWPDFDFIIPVPMDRMRQWERGFNQSYLLALLVEKFSKIPLTNHVLKKRNTASPQSRLSKEARLFNIQGNFKVHKPAKTYGRRILLVDDIYTTGATVNECARVLKEAGADSVCAFTLARASLEKDVL